MTTLSLFPISLSTPSTLNQLLSKPNSRHPSFSHRLRTRPIVFRSTSSQQTNDPSIYKDENGVIDDMDGYLNYLSLEYDSVWNTKPSWCQPWTIVLTGVLVVAFSWLLFRSIVVSTGAFLLIGAWWYIFLYSYPKAYSDMIEERRKNITEGVEDTYGSKKSL